MKANPAQETEAALQSSHYLRTAAEFGAQHRQSPRGTCQRHGTCSCSEKFFRFGLVCFSCGHRPPPTSDTY